MKKSSKALYKLFHNSVKDFFGVYNPNCPFSVEGVVNVAEHCLRCPFFQGIRISDKAYRGKIKVICKRETKQVGGVSAYLNTIKVRSKQELEEIWRGVYASNGKISTKKLGRIGRTR